MDIIFWFLMVRNLGAAWLCHEAAAKLSVRAAVSPKGSAGAAGSTTVGGRPQVLPTGTAQNTVTLPVTEKGSSMSSVT